ncbi:MAG: hypothetical protein AAFR99_22265, partial [Cyanobacteria bacterium J06629_9]
LPSRELAPGKAIGKKLLGEPIVIGRHRDGSVFALQLFTDGFAGRQLTAGQRNIPKIVQQIDHLAVNRL